MVKAAQKAGKDQAIQRDIDNMTQRLAAGGEPGMDLKTIPGTRISYLRSRNGARVFYRVVGDTYQILGKASKANEGEVINILKDLYGH